MYYYVVNPAAGGGAINSIQEKLKSSLRNLKIDGEFAKTLGEGDASQITKKAIDKGVNTIVAVGGNSTVNEIITTIYRQRKTDVAIGIIPTGKQNTLADSLGIENWRHATEILAARRLAEYSLMTLNDHVFIHSLQIHPLQHNSESGKDPGRWNKFMANRPAGKPLSFKATIDKDLKLRGDCSYMEMYNQKFIDSSLDNLLLMRIYGSDSYGKFATRFGSIFGRNQDNVASGTSQLHGKQLTLSSQRMAEAHLDGKTVSGKQFDVALTNLQLRLITSLARRSST